MSWHPPPGTIRPRYPTELKWKAGRATKLRRGFRVEPLPWVEIPGYYGLVARSQAICLRYLRKALGLPSKARLEFMKVTPVLELSTHDAFLSILKTGQVVLLEWVTVPAPRNVRYRYPDLFRKPALNLPRPHRARATFPRTIERLEPSNPIPVDLEVEVPVSDWLEIY